MFASLHFVREINAHRDVHKKTTLRLISFAYVFLVYNINKYPCSYFGGCKIYYEILFSLS